MKTLSSFLSSGDGRAPIHLYSFVQTAIKICRTQAECTWRYLPAAPPFSSHPDPIQHAQGPSACISQFPPTPANSGPQAAEGVHARVWFTVGRTWQILNVSAGQISRPRVSACSVQAWVVTSPRPWGLLDSIAVGGAWPKDGQCGTVYSVVSWAGI